VRAGLFGAPQRLIPPRTHAGRELVVALDDVHGVPYAGFGGGHTGLTRPGAHLRVPCHWIVAPQATAPILLRNVCGDIQQPAAPAVVIATFFGIMPATFAFASAGAGLDSVIMAAKAEYARCVAQGGAQACRLSIHASSLVTRQLVLALLLLGVVALIPVILRKWRNNHAAAK
jgi:hypothetical protein